jgi:hypothetical protein
LEWGENPDPIKSNCQAARIKFIKKKIPKFQEPPIDRFYIDKTLTPDLQISNVDRVYSFLELTIERIPIKHNAHLRIFLQSLWYPF